MTAQGLFLIISIVSLRSCHSFIFPLFCFSSYLSFLLFLTQKNVMIFCVIETIGGRYEKACCLPAFVFFCSCFRTKFVPCTFAYFVVNQSIECKGVICFYSRNSAIFLFSQRVLVYHSFTLFSTLREVINTPSIELNYNLIQGVARAMQLNRKLNRTQLHSLKL